MDQVERYDISFHGEGDERSFVDEKNTLPLKLDEDVDANSSSPTEKIENTKLCVRRHWKPFEDAKLRELVAQFSPHNWNNIAEHLEGRSGKSCRLRWFNHLDPTINKTTFTAEEEERLLAAQNVHSNKWAIICKLFPGRSDNAVKNHWHVLMARKQREKSSSEKRREITFESPPMGFKKMALSNNTISGLTISSTSTCTNPSLTTVPFQFQNNIQNYQTYESQMGMAGGSLGPVEDLCIDKLFSAMKGYGHKGKLVMRVDQSNYCESESEVVTLSESVAINRNNQAILGESENVDDKLKVPIIDFLGVGNCWSSNLCSKDQKAEQVKVEVVLGTGGKEIVVISKEHCGIIFVML